MNARRLPKARYGSVALWVFALLTALIASCEAPTVHYSAKVLLVGTAVNLVPWQDNDATIDGASVKGGKLPPGLAIQSDGTIVGSPTTPGDYTSTIEACAGSDCDTTPVALRVVNQLGLHYVSPEAFVLNVPIVPIPPRVDFGYLNGENKFVLRRGVLPPGMFLDAATGAISGTPSEVTSAPIDLEIVVEQSASDGYHAPYFAVAMGTVQLTVSGRQLLGYATPVTYVQNTKIAPNRPVTEGFAPVSFTTSAGVLPAGLALDATSGVIDGTPTTVGASTTVRVRALDGRNYPLEQDIVMTVLPPLPRATYTSALATVTMPFTLAASNAGGPVVSSTIAAGELPPGLALFADGTVSGTPSLAGVFSSTVRHCNENGCATAPLVIDVDPRSCAGLARLCGASGNVSCCGRGSVPGGTFLRSDSSSAPATVSAFALDTYEATVGRFRRFAGLGGGTQQSPPASGSGNVLGNPATGWDQTSTSRLPADALALGRVLHCDPQAETWTDTSGANETLPIVCVDWSLAQAFCIWDGGRLPTEAEWNFAASGGDEQRPWPWSRTAPTSTLDTAHVPAWDTASFDRTFLATAGSRERVAAGRWGHADLIGNALEWVYDVFDNPYPAPCTNCAVTSGTNQRVLRGGSYFVPIMLMQTSHRMHQLPTDVAPDFGFRCARAR